MWKHPPGDEIYRKGNISVFEVDGKKNKVKECSAAPPGLPLARITELRQLQHSIPFFAPVFPFQYFKSDSPDCLFFFFFRIPVCFQEFKSETTAKCMFNDQ